MAKSILAGSTFSNAYARNMLYGILEEVHRAVLLVRVDQHVDDLAQCAVGHQTAVIQQMVEAAEIATFACGRLSTVFKFTLSASISDPSNSQSKKERDTTKYVRSPSRRRSLVHWCQLSF